ncbi:MAG: hypothetical protein EOM54_03385 [Clostridia bacterium]|nr:hypothetical protein [Clostridia bacterium]
MKRLYAILITAVLFCCFLCGCEGSDPVYDNGDNDGYNDGKNAGYSEGYKEGYQMAVNGILDRMDKWYLERWWDANEDWINEVGLEY